MKYNHSCRRAYGKVNSTSKEADKLP